MSNNSASPAPASAKHRSTMERWPLRMASCKAVPQYVSMWKHVNMCLLSNFKPLRSWQASFAWSLDSKVTKQKPEPLCVSIGIFKSCCPKRLQMVADKIRFNFQSFSGSTSGTPKMQTVRSWPVQEWSQHQMHC